jgi:hypothetical protein
VGKNSINFYGIDDFSSHRLAAAWLISGPLKWPTLSPAPTAWLLSRYDDALAMLKDERLAKDKLNARKPSSRRTPRDPALFKPLTRNMLDICE